MKLNMKSFEAQLCRQWRLFGLSHSDDALSLSAMNAVDRLVYWLDGQADCLDSLYSVHDDDVEACKIEELSDSLRFLASTAIRLAGIYRDDYLAILKGEVQQ